MQRQKLVSMSGETKPGTGEFSISVANMDYEKLLSDRARESLSKLSPKGLDKVVTVASEILANRDEHILKEREEKERQSAPAKPIPEEVKPLVEAAWKPPKRRACLPPALLEGDWQDLLQPYSVTESSTSDPAVE